MMGPMELPDFESHPPLPMHPPLGHISWAQPPDVEDGGDEPGLPQRQLGPAQHQLHVYEEEWLLPLPGLLSYAPHRPQVPSFSF